MFSVLRPSRPGPMLEIGAGIGTFSALLLEHGADPLSSSSPRTHASPSFGAASMATRASRSRRRCCPTRRRCERGGSVPLRALPERARAHRGRRRRARRGRRRTRAWRRARGARPCAPVPLRPARPAVRALPPLHASTGSRAHSRCRCELTDLRSFNMLGVPGLVDRRAEPSLLDIRRARCGSTRLWSGLAARRGRC